MAVLSSEKLACTMPDCTPSGYGKPFVSRQCSPKRSAVPARGCDSPLVLAIRRPGVYMRISRYFMPILRDDPKEAEIVSHRLMLRTGMIRQEAAGSYSWLPLGYRVLKRIEQIVREEQDR